MRTTTILAALLFLAPACVGPAERGRLAEEQPGSAALEPSFSPLAPEGAAGSPDAPEGTAASERPQAPPTASADTPVVPGAPDGTGPTAGSDATVGPARRDAARLDDPAGDVTGLGSPDWADLRAARLIRSDGSVTLTHVLDTAAPEQGDGQDTMNIATFVDVTGDGTIDYEIWANLSAEGWGTSYFDEREGTARYAADDEIDVAVVDGAVRLRFPTSHFGEAPTFRWSVASEHGPYQAIGTDAMARDYLPDDRSGRWFPD